MYMMEVNDVLPDPNSIIRDESAAGRIISSIELETGDEPADGVGVPLPNGVIVLNVEQERICNRLFLRGRNRINSNIDPIQCPFIHDQLLMYLDNGPGTGKSSIVIELFRRLNVYAIRMNYNNVTTTTSYTCSATTGQAAVVLRHGCMTFDKLHKSYIFEKNDTNSKLPALSLISKLILLITCSYYLFVLHSTI